MTATTKMKLIVPGGKYPKFSLHYKNSSPTNSYRLPKMHGMTKMQSYIKCFGSGMNFYGSQGEAAHKTFVKSAGQKTQRRVGKFAQQTAH
jgi:hypothetical protein